MAGQLPKSIAKPLLPFGGKKHSHFLLYLRPGISDFFIAAGLYAQPENPAEKPVPDGHAVAADGAGGLGGADLAGDFQL